MRLTIALLVLVNVYFSNAKSLPAVIENPCKQDELYKLQFYFPYPDDETRFIECNPWGEMTIKECPQSSKWNQWLSSCIIPVPQQEMPVEDTMNTTMPTSFCSYYGNSTCQNGGFCNQYIFESKCLCLPNYSGDYCEVSMPTSGAFSQLINETFSIDLYKKQRPLGNDSIASDFNNTFDLTITDEAKKQIVQKYFDLYSNGEMRYDTFMYYLLQDILSALYPNTFFLREFELEGEMQLGYSNAIPNLLQSAKYAFDHFDNFWLICESVVSYLIDYLPKHMPKIHEESKSFFDAYNVVFSLTNNGSAVDMILKNPYLQRDVMKKKINEDFNITLQYAYDLFRYLNAFDDELSIRGQNFTSEEMKYALGNFSIDAETTRILGEIQAKNIEMFNSLTFYGFWNVFLFYVPESVNGPASAKAGALQSESTTTAVPIVGARLAESTVLPTDQQPILIKGDAQLSESTTMLPIVDALLGESTTVLPTVNLLINDSSTKLPTAVASRLSPFKRPFDEDFPDFQ